MKPAYSLPRLYTEQYVVAVCTVMAIRGHRVVYRPGTAASHEACIASSRRGACQHPQHHRAAGRGVTGGTSTRVVQKTIVVEEWACAAAPPTTPSVLVCSACPPLQTLMRPMRLHVRTKADPVG
jgi:hypothetical protein